MTKDVFGLYLVLTFPEAGYEKTMEAAIEQSVRYVQLRHKPAPIAETRAIAGRLRAMSAGTATRFIVNDDAQLAEQVGADGVHVGQDDRADTDLRWAKHGRLWGLSTHNEQQAIDAERLAPTYIGVGPVYATPTKTVADPVLSLKRAGKIVRESALTCVAIGGINAGNLSDVIAAGIDNFAVVRAVCASMHPAEPIAQLLDIAGEARAKRDVQP